MGIVCRQSFNVCYIYIYIHWFLPSAPGLLLPDPTPGCRTRLWPRLLHRTTPDEWWCYVNMGMQKWATADGSWKLGGSKCWDMPYLCDLVWQLFTWRILQAESSMIWTVYRTCWLENDAMLYGCQMFPYAFLHAVRAWTSGIIPAMGQFSRTNPVILKGNIRRIFYILSFFT